MHSRSNEAGGTGLFVGTSGWTYDDWSGVFYPPEIRGAERLAFYATKFCTVEVNATFYRFPTPAMVAAWNRRLPADFALVLKGHRRITHEHRLVGAEEALRSYLERLKDLHRLAVLLWQLPPSQQKDVPRLAAFLARLPTPPRHAVEFRHRSWWDDETAEALARYGAAFVAVSHPRLPDAILPTTDLLYVRFHGLGARLYDYDYSSEELSGWAERLRPHLAGRTLFAFFNNDHRACAVANAQAFRSLLEADRRQASR